MGHSPLRQYGVAVLTVAVALLIVLNVTRSGQGAAQVFLAAVMVSAWYGGLGPGLLVTTLAALTLEFILPPAYSLGRGTDNALRVVMFLLVALLISSLNAAKRRLEWALRKEHRRMDDFLSVLGHELRNPLGTLANAVQILRLDRDDPDAVERTGDIMERQVRHMSRLINDVLDASRIRQGKLELHKERVELAAVVADAVEATRFLIEERRQGLDLFLPAYQIALEADPTRLEQVVVNLFTNASKFTEAGGRIEVGAEIDHDEVLLYVRDDGQGITTDLLPRIFDLHVQAENGSHGGLGIGLCLVRSLVEMHGGSVTAYSAGRGRGSEFVVRLPARKTVSEQNTSQHIGSVQRGNRSA